MMVAGSRVNQVGFEGKEVRWFHGTCLGWVYSNIGSCIMLLGVGHAIVSHKESTVYDVVIK